MNRINRVFIIIAVAATLIVVSTSASAQGGESSKEKIRDFNVAANKTGTHTYKLGFILRTCYDRIAKDDLSVLDQCIEIFTKFNNMTDKFMNETQGAIITAVLG
jgi:hypothetical protein